MNEKKEAYLNRYKQLLREYFCCITGQESKMCKREQFQEAEYVLKEIFGIDDCRSIYDQIYLEASDNNWKYGYWNGNTDDDSNDWIVKTF